jgi:hypothetical protein
MDDRMRCPSEAYIEGKAGAPAKWVVAPQVKGATRAPVIAAYLGMGK